jgi:hypothetical protein
MGHGPPEVTEPFAKNTFSSPVFVGFGTTQTSRARPDMSVHWGEAVKVTPCWK